MSSKRKTYQEDDFIDFTKDDLCDTIYDEYTSGSSSENDKTVKRVSRKRSKTNSTKSYSRKKLDQTDNCKEENCELCKNGLVMNVPLVRWKEILMAIFYYFKKREIEDTTTRREWLYMPDAYEFIGSHWSVFTTDTTSYTRNWKKTLQDTLSHSKGLFISRGAGYNGYWRLKDGFDLSVYFNKESSETSKYSLRSNIITLNDNCGSENQNTLWDGLHVLANAVEMRESLQCTSVQV
jgi:hypothetical protein